MGYRRNPEATNLFSPFDQGETTISIEAYPAFECDECGYVWTPRVSEPSSCPQCNGEIDYNDSEIDAGYDEIQHQWLSDGKRGELTEMRGLENEDGNKSDLQDVDKEKSDTDRDEGDKKGWYEQ